MFLCYGDDADTMIELLLRGISDDVTSCATSSQRVPNNAESWQKTIVYLILAMMSQLSFLTEGLLSA
jgi:hypothetical protein